MGTKAAPPLPPTDVEDADWDDNRFMHYIAKKPNGEYENFTLCGAEIQQVYRPSDEQLKHMPRCVICCSLAALDGRWHTE